MDSKTINLKLDKLRLQYRDAKTDVDRKLITIRAKCLKIALEKYEKTNGRKLL